MLSIPSILVHRRYSYSVLDGDHRAWHLVRERRQLLLNVWPSKSRWDPGFLVAWFLTRLPHQVLAVFAALPPMIEVAYLAPDLRHWWTNLAWVRFVNRRVIPFITGRPALETPDPKEMGTHDIESMKETSENKDGYD